MDKTCSYWRGGGLCYKEIQKEHEKWRDGASEDWIHEQFHGVRLGYDDKWSWNLGIKQNSMEEGRGHEVLLFVQKQQKISLQLQQLENTRNWGEIPNTSKSKHLNISARLFLLCIKFILYFKFHHVFCLTWGPHPLSLALYRFFSHCVR